MIRVSLSMYLFYVALILRDYPFDWQGRRKTQREVMIHRETEKMENVGHRDETDQPSWRFQYYIHNHCSVVRDRNSICLSYALEKLRLMRGVRYLWTGCQKKITN